MTRLLAPDPRLRAVVVVPARDESERIGACLQALADQRGVAPHAYEVLLVLDRCRDDTEARARSTATRCPDLRLRLAHSEVPGVGAARRWGMDTACERLLAVGRGRGLIASTDADSTVAEDWLARQLELVAGGAAAIGGRVEIADREARLLPEEVLAARRAEARLRLARVRASDNGRNGRGPGPAQHHHFSGASLSLTAETYRRVGGLPPVHALEDEALEQTLEERGIHILRPDAVRVITSGRTRGRAPRGLSRDLALSDWRARRSFAAAHFSARDLARRRRHSVSVVIPAREVAATVGQIVDTVVGLERIGLVDEVLVVDAGSRDGTARVADGRGARVVQEDALLAEFGPARGKGDAMWRGLSATSGEIVVYLDADTENFEPEFVVGLLGPLLDTPEIAFVKGAFHRPFRLGERVMAGEGGRVTELVARPLLNLYAPELAGFDQPLAGEIAGRRELLESLPFPAGYGIEIGMLIDAARTAGLDALAQVDLGVRQNRHQPLRDLSAMAYAVIVAAESRLHGADVVGERAPGPLALPPAVGESTMELRQVVVDERPPLATLAVAADEAQSARAATRPA